MRQHLGNFSQSPFGLQFPWDFAGRDRTLHFPLGFNKNLHINLIRDRLYQIFGTHESHKRMIFRENVSDLGYVRHHKILEAQIRREFQVIVVAQDNGGGLFQEHVLLFIRAGVHNNGGAYFSYLLRGCLRTDRRHTDLHSHFPCQKTADAYTVTVTIVRGQCGA